MYSNAKDWSKSVAELAADALIDASIIDKAQLDKTVDIIAEEVLVRLCLNDCPLPDQLSSWSFVIEEQSANHFVANGRNKNGNRVSREGVDTDTLMLQVIADAFKIENEVKKA